MRTSCAISVSILAALLAQGCGDSRSCTGTACTGGPHDAGNLDAGGAPRDGGGVDSGALAVDAGGGTDAGGVMVDAGGGGSVPGGTIRVTVRRSAGLTFGGDGSGTLYIDVGSMCPYSAGIDVLMTTTHGTVDMTSPSFSMTYDIAGVPPGTWAVWAWLDDNGDAMGFPNGGDAGNYPVCPTATVTATAGAAVDTLFESSTWN